MGAEHCDERVCLSVHTHISETTCPLFKLLQSFRASYQWPLLGRLPLAELRMVTLSCASFKWLRGIALSRLLTATGVVSGWGRD